jgi:hypothetical protein
MYPIGSNFFTLFTSLCLSFCLKVYLLKGFLKWKFNLDWLDKAKDIKKIKNDSALLISYKSQSILIELDNNRTRATLKINRQRKFEFIVKLWTKDFFVITAPVTPIAKYAVKSLLTTVRQVVPSFVFNLASNAVPNSSTFQILAKDERFLRILEKTKRSFDNQYTRFTQKEGDNL